MKKVNVLEKGKKIKIKEEILIVKKLNLTIFVPAQAKNRKK